MAGHSRADVRRIILTASGGPFAGLSAEDLEKVTMADTLRHPRWKMGAKVTVDSATLMNKGFEVIEAKWLFDIPVDRIEILIHRQSAIHSMVEYVDGSVVAQLGIADMRVPIAYALSYPGRLELPLPALDLGMLGSLTFERPDPVAFPAYTYAYDAARIGGSAPAALCAADDVAVEAFLSGRIAFPAIAKIIGGVLESHVPFDVDDEHGVFEAARRGRERARELACMCQGA
jgi:1-deoxy-D-xylulose-5-phosphate reductoisomerase